MSSSRSSRSSQSPSYNRRFGGKKRNNNKNNNGIRSPRITNTKVNPKFNNNSMIF